MQTGTDPADQLSIKRTRILLSAAAATGQGHTNHPGSFITILSAAFLAMLGKWKPLPTPPDVCTRCPLLCPAHLGGDQMSGTFTLPHPAMACLWHYTAIKSYRSYTGPAADSHHHHNSTRTQGLWLHGLIVGSGSEVDV